MAGFRTKQFGQKKYTVDNYESNSIWIGVFCHEEVISCLRVVYRTEDKNLDIEGYSGYLHPAVVRMLKINNLVEVQRRAMKSTYRGQGINYIMHAALCKLLIQTDINYFVTQGGHFLGHQFGTLIHDKFDYGDGKNRKVTFYSTKEIRNLLQVCVKRYYHLNV